jgi:hypothetical protein
MKSERMVPIVDFDGVKPAPFSFSAIWSMVALGSAMTRRFISDVTPVNGLAVATFLDAGAAGALAVVGVAAVAGVRWPAAQGNRAADSQGSHELR